jgi:redox-sensitive bicupin YhaK (pirin superfamily)
MTTKAIESIISPPAPHMVGDGFRVHNFIPGHHRMSMERMSPFIMMDYNSRISFPPKETPRGVGVHPHRGFETVTIAYKGKVAHHDSTGNSGIISEGDVQWMTAAYGVLHKEYHEQEFSRKGGEFQMVQLWVNLPAKDKLSAPKYQAIENNRMGRFELDNEQGFVEVIAGAYQTVAGPASTFTPVNMMNAKLKNSGTANFSFPASFNTLALVVEGNALINGQKVGTDQLALFSNEGEDFVVQADGDAIVLILSGEPIKEPIAAYGPFVMNTREELIQAFEDMNKGKFGVLED